MTIKQYSEHIGDHDIVRMEKVRLYTKEKAVSVLQAQIDFLQHNIVPYRYIGNVRLFGIEGQIKLLESKICVVGCGGLGGTICELLARLGIGTLVLADPDVFEEHNLNRQLMCTQDNIGQSKVICSKNRIKTINSAVQVAANIIKADEQNIKKLLEGCCMCIDAVDNVRTRLCLEQACLEKGIPLIHGAIGDAQYQVAAIQKRAILKSIYGDSEVLAIAANPAPTVTACAALQVGEAVKIITGQGESLNSSLLIENWMYNSHDILNL